MLLACCTIVFFTYQIGLPELKHLLSRLPAAAQQKAMNNLEFFTE
jgi:hypothetical protein